MKLIKSNTSYALFKGIKRYKKTRVFLILFCLLVSHGVPQTSKAQNNSVIFEKSIESLHCSKDNKFNINDRTLVQLFSHLKPYLYKIRELINNYAHDIKKSKESWKSAGLSMCGCDNFKLPQRILLAFKQLNDVVAQYPHKNQQIIHTSLGSGRLLQTYLFIKACVAVGYTNIHINAIDPAINDYESVAANFITAIQRDNNHATITLSYYKNSDEYSIAIKNGDAKKSHSFDMVDVGGTDWIGLNTFNETYLSSDYIKTNKEKFNAHNALHINGPRGTFMHIYIPSNHHSNIIVIDKQSIKCVNKKQRSRFNKLLNFSKQLKSKTKSRDIAMCLAHISKKTNWVKRWIGAKNLSLSVGIGHVAWLDFAQLIEQTKEQNPIIYEGYSNIIKKYHSHYRGYISRIKQSDLVQNKGDKIIILQ